MATVVNKKKKGTKLGNPECACFLARCRGRYAGRGLSGNDFAAGTAVPADRRPVAATGNGLDENSTSVEGTRFIGGELFMAQSIDRIRSIDPRKDAAPIPVVTNLEIEANAEYGLTGPATFLRPRHVAKYQIIPLPGNHTLGLMVLLDMEFTRNYVPDLEARMIPHKKAVVATMAELASLPKPPDIIMLAISGWECIEQICFGRTQEELEQMAVAELIDEVPGLDIVVVDDVLLYRGIKPRHGRNWAGQDVAIVPATMAAYLPWSTAGETPFPNIINITASFDRSGRLGEWSAVPVPLDASVDELVNAKLQSRLEANKSEVDAALDAVAGELGKVVVGEPVLRCNETDQPPESCTFLPFPTGINYVGPPVASLSNYPTKNGLLPMTVLYGGCLLAECTGGNLVADAMLVAGRRLASRPVMFSLINGGALHRNLDPGPVTSADLVQFLANLHTISVVTMKGSHVRQILSLSKIQLSQANSYIEPNYGAIQQSATLRYNWCIDFESGLGSVPDGNVSSSLRADTGNVLSRVGMIEVAHNFTVSDGVVIPNDWVVLKDEELYDVVTTSYLIDLEAHLDLHNGNPPDLKREDFYDQLHEVVGDFMSRAGAAVSVDVGSRIRQSPVRCRIPGADAGGDSSRYDVEQTDSSAQSDSDRSDASLSNGDSPNAEETKTAVIIGLTLGTCVIMIGTVLFVLLIRTKKYRNKAHDFKQDLSRLVRAGELSADNSTMLFVPREIERRDVQLLDLLGEGVFGEVYKAMLTETQTLADGSTIPSYLAAVKTAKNDPRLPGRAAAELLSEATFMAQVAGHSNLVTLIGVVTRGEPKMLLVSYCEHGSTLEYIRRNPGLPIVTKCMWLLDVAKGMSFLAAQSFVHRDLAARNALLDSAYCCRVADFGLSRVTKNKDSGSAEYYRSQNGVFPVRWTAPEAMERSVFSQASDVWSWAIVACELCNDGASPYLGLSTTEVMAKVADGYRLPRPASCPVELYALLQMCWAAEPSERPSFQMIVDQMVVIVEGEKSPSARPSADRGGPGSDPTATPDNQTSNDEATFILQRRGSRSATALEPVMQPNAGRRSSVSVGELSCSQLSGDSTTSENSVDRSWGSDKIDTPRESTSEPPEQQQSNGGNAFTSVIAAIKKSVRGGFKLVDGNGLEDREPNTELVSDLILVAGFHRLGQICANDVYENSGHLFGDVVMLYLILRLAWQNLNMIRAQFQLAWPRRMYEYITMLLTSLLVISMGQYDQAADGNRYLSSGIASPLFQAIWIGNRGFTVLLHFICGLANRSAREISAMYVALRLFSVCLTIIALFLNDRSYFVTLTALAVAVEMLVDPLVLLLSPKDKIPPIDIEHNIERAEMWAILALGEAMLSLLNGTERAYHRSVAGFYLDVILSLGVLLLMMVLHMRSRPNHHRYSGMDAHCYDVSPTRAALFDYGQTLLAGGLFVLGLGLRFAVMFGHYDGGQLFDREYAWLASGGAAVSVLGILGSRFAHEWAQFKCVMSTISRRLLWSVHGLVSIGVLLLALTIRTSSTAATADSTLTPTEYLTSILALLCIAYFTDRLTEPTDGVVSQLETFHEAVALLLDGDITKTVIGKEYPEAAIRLAAKRILKPRIAHVGDKVFRFSSARATLAMKVASKRAHDVSDKAAIRFLDAYYHSLVEHDDPADPLSAQNLANIPVSLQAYNALQRTADLLWYASTACRSQLDVLLRVRTKYRAAPDISLDPTYNSTSNGLRVPDAQPDDNNKHSRASLRGVVFADDRSDASPMRSLSGITLVPGSCPMDVQLVEQPATSPVGAAIKRTSSGMIVQFQDPNPNSTSMVALQNPKQTPSGMVVQLHEPLQNSAGMVVRMPTGYAPNSPYHARRTSSIVGRTSLWPSRASSIISNNSPASNSPYSPQLRNSMSELPRWSIASGPHYEYAGSVASAFANTPARSSCAGVQLTGQLSSPVTIRPLPEDLSSNTPDPDQGQSAADKESRRMHMYSSLV